MAKLIPYIIILSLSLLSFFGTAIAEEMELPPYKGSQPFESMKSLAGHWEGSKVTGNQEEPVKVEYKVSSNGSTIVETLFPGTQHEMVTVYYDTGGQLSLTHYCAIGNQPKMDLVKADGNVLEFTLANSNEIEVDKEGHMHGLTLTMVDKDHLQHNWSLYQKGKEGGTTTITLARVE